jgi:uncharacterized repeat protein (TIGR03803 family)
MRKTLRAWCQRYRSAIVALAALTTVINSASAQTETVLYTFMGTPDEAASSANLVQNAQGNYIGTTSSGGTVTSSFPQGCGTVFEVTPDGNETILYRFKGAPDGASPKAGLVLDEKGNMYGTTYSGGAHGLGTVFEISAKGKEKVLYSFTGRPDGDAPQSNLAFDKKGSLYGTTISGGAHGYGVVFKVSRSGKEKVLYSFAGTPDGAAPEAGVVLDGTGNLYGTTTYGGPSQPSKCQQGCGVVFKVTPAGKESVLYGFEAGTDGSSPTAGLLLDKAGNLYGTTIQGGGSVHCGGGCGTVFELTSAGQETVLYSFGASNNDGAFPQAGLIVDSAGNFYGTTNGAGSAFGTVFELTPSGRETILHSFKGTPDGSSPQAGLLLDPSSDLIGTTFAGGNSDGYGVVFKVVP